MSIVTLGTQTSVVLVLLPSCCTSGELNRYFSNIFSSEALRESDLTVASMYFILVSIKYLGVLKEVFSYFKGILNYFWRLASSAGYIQQVIANT